MGFSRRKRAGIPNERFAEREIQVHRARSGVDTRPIGTPRQRSPCPGGVVTGHARGVEPPHRTAEQVGLVDGLGGTHVEQFGRAVRGEDDHRHAREVRLDDGGVEVRAGCARRAENYRRPSRRQSMTESGE